MRVFLHQIFLLVVLIGFVTPAVATPPRIRAGNLDLGVRMDYFTTTSNFDGSGNSFSLAAGRSYTNYGFRAISGYGINKNWLVKGGLGWALAESTSISANRNNSELTDLSVGSNYIWVTKPFTMVPEFNFFFPFNRITATRDTAITSEGAMGFTLGSWFAKRMGSMYNFAYLGYRYQDEGRAGLADYAIGTNFRIPSFSIGGEIAGSQTMINDDYTSKPLVRNAVTAVTNGGSWRYYSVNPSIANINAWLGFRFADSWEGQVGMGYPIWGQNTAIGFNFYASLAWNTVLGRPSRPTEPSFVPETEKYDESLFRSQQQPSYTPPPTKPAAPARPQKSDQQMLDEAEDLLN